MSNAEFFDIAASQHIGFTTMEKLKEHLQNVSNPMHEYRSLLVQYSDLSESDRLRAFDAIETYLTSENRNDLYASPLFEALASKANQSLFDIVYYQLELAGRRPGLIAMGTVSTERRAGSIAEDGAMVGDEERKEKAKKAWEDFLKSMAEYDYIYLAIMENIDQTDKEIDLRIKQIEDKLKNSKLQTQIKGDLLREKEKLKKHKKKLKEKRAILESEELQNPGDLKNLQERVQNVVNAVQTHANNVTSLVARSSSKMGSNGNGKKTPLNLFSSSNNSKNNGGNTGKKSDEEEEEPPSPT